MLRWVLAEPRLTVVHQQPKSNSRPMAMYVQQTRAKLLPPVNCNSFKRQCAEVCPPFSWAFFCRCRDRRCTLQSARPSVRRKRRVLVVIFIWGHLTAGECAHARYTRKHLKILLSCFKQSQLCLRRSAGSNTCSLSDGAARAGEHVCRRLARASNSRRRAAKSLVSPCSPPSVPFDPIPAPLCHPPPAPFTHTCCYRDSWNSGPPQFHVQLHFLE